MRRVFMAIGFAVIAATSSFAEIRTYGFDDGTFQGWSYLNADLEPFDPEESDVSWKLTTDEVDLGENDWNLLQGSTVNGIGSVGNPQREPNPRFIPEPWDNRDCIGGSCLTQLMVSPKFRLDDSGPISVDIMGGAAQGGRAFDPEADTPPEIPFDLEFEKSGTGWQGFALYDMAGEEYVAWGFPSFTNDGKEKDGRDVWETVQIPAADFADRAGDGKDYQIHVFDSHSGGWGWIGFDTVKIPTQRITATWDGGDGVWTDGSWNGGKEASAMFGRTSGTDGAESINLGEDIIIGGGATVSYDGNSTGDFRIKQGSTLTITEGATWVQETTPAWSENRWTQIDASKLTLDNGTFKRVGAAKLGGNDDDPLGGGALIFGSWRGDDTFDSGTPFPEQIDVDILNGGKLENEGQLWLGAWDDHPAGLEVTITIDDGMIDLTGGDVMGVGEAADADLVLFYGIDTEGKFTENAGDPKNESYVINFVGPGSITVDESGIIAPMQVAEGDGFVWTNLDKIGYEDLWEMGVLQAEGQSGPDGANFADFFSVTGALGSDDYVLNSLIGALFDCDGDGQTGAGDLGCVTTVEDRDTVLGALGTLAGDLDGNGEVDFADFLVLSTNFGNSGAGYSDGNIDLAGDIDFADFLVLSNNFGLTAASAVPEPSASLLVCLAGLVVMAARRKRS